MPSVLHNKYPKKKVYISVLLISEDPKLLLSIYLFKLNFELQCILQEFPSARANNEF